MSIRCIVFDLGGVVVDVDRLYLIQGIRQATGLAKQAVEDILFAPTNHAQSLSDQYHTGHLDSEQFLSAITGQFDYKVNNQQLLDIWLAMLRGENAAVLKVIKLLQQRFTLACYSNSNAIHWEHMFANYRCFDYFNQSMSSHQEGLLKPDPKVYELVTRRLNATPQECLLVDDLEENINGAIQAGWQGIRFSTAKALEQALKVA